MVFGLWPVNSQLGEPQGASSPLQPPGIGQLLPLLSQPIIKNPIAATRAIIPNNLTVRFIENLLSMVVLVLWWGLVKGTRGNLLEIMYNLIDEHTAYVFHAMPCRKTFRMLRNQD